MECSSVISDPRLMWEGGSLKVAPIGTIWGAFLSVGFQAQLEGLGQSIPGYGRSLGLELTLRGTVLGLLR